jgi:hypothetical protein
MLQVVAIGINQPTSFHYWNVYFVKNGLVLDNKYKQKVILNNFSTTRALISGT